jgi:hypothetical protein
MKDSFKIRSGKYKGKTLGWVKENDLRYLMWVRENRPEMLKEMPKPKPKVTNKETPPANTKVGGMTRNETFYDECIDESSVPHMLKFPDKYADELARFKKENKKRFRLITEGIKKNK